MYKALFANIDGGTYNAGTGIKTTLQEQIQGMIDVFSPPNAKSHIIYKPEVSNFTNFVMDIENAKVDLGYKPEYTYLKYLKDYKKEQGLKRFDDLWKNCNYSDLYGNSVFRLTCSEKVSISVVGWLSNRQRIA